MVCVKNLLALLALAGVTVCMGCATAEIDARADDVLKSMSDVLGEAESFSFKAETVSDRPGATGQLIQLSRKLSIQVVRPGKLRVESAGDIGKRGAWYDGKTVTILDRIDQTYAVVDAPPTIEATLAEMLEKHRLSLPLADLLVGSPYETLLANVRTGRYIGRHTVGGTLCHHLAFRQANLDWQIWIDAGETPVPRKVKIVYTKVKGLPQFSATLTDWNLSAKANDATFRFKAPAGAKKVTMAELLKAGKGK